MEERKCHKRGVFGKINAAVKNLVHIPTRHLGVKEVRQNENVIHQGHLRKKPNNKMMDAMHMHWKTFYVIITDKVIYYFKSDLSSSFVGKFSLYGYNVVRRVSSEEHTHWPRYALELQHASHDLSQYKNHYFAASHEEECRTWLVEIRRGMILAHQSVVKEMSAGGLDASSGIEALQEPIYPSSEFQRADDSQEEDVESYYGDYEEIPDVDEEFVPEDEAVSQGIHPSNSRPTDSYIGLSGRPTATHQSPLQNLPPPPPDYLTYSEHWTPSLAAKNSDCSYSTSGFAPSKNEWVAEDIMPKTMAPHLPVHARALRPPIAPKPARDCRDHSFGVVPSNEERSYSQQRVERPDSEYESDASVDSSGYTEMDEEMTDQISQHCESSRKALKQPGFLSRDPSVVYKSPSVPSSPEQHISPAVSSNYSQHYTPTSPPIAVKSKAPTAMGPTPVDLSMIQNVKLKKVGGKGRDTAETAATPVLQQKALKPPVLDRQNTLSQENIYWNGDKEEVNRVLKSSLVGTFLIRKSSNEPKQLVLAVLADDGAVHSFKINQYSDGTMGFITSSTEIFSDIESLLKYYRENDLCLKGGLLSMRLRSAHPRCEAHLNDQQELR